MAPQGFRTGDLVSVQLSFKVVHLHAEKYKMLLVLCSVTLLDGSYMQVSRDGRLIQGDCTYQDLHRNPASNKVQLEQSQICWTMSWLS